MKPKKQTIKIACRDRVLDVEAKVIGPFAYHPTATEKGASPSYFTVTHIETGCAIAQYINKAGIAAALIRDLLEATDEWNTYQHQIGSEAHQRISTASAPVLRRYREEGLI